MVFENGIKRKHSKSGYGDGLHRKVNPDFRSENNIIPNSDALQMLGVTVD